MIEHRHFDYTAEQWDLIAGCVILMRNRNDAHLLHRGGASLKQLIWLEANMYCAQPRYQASGGCQPSSHSKLDALRDDLQDRLVPTLAKTTDVDTATWLRRPEPSSPN